MTLDRKAEYTAKQLSGQRILITGADGFFGRHLVNMLRVAGANRLTLIDLYPPGASNSDGEKSIALDLTNRDQVLQFGQDQHFDTVFHLAGKIDQSIRSGIYLEQFKLHFEATLNLIDAFSPHNPGRFIYVGSNAEYGNASCPHSHTTCEAPNSAYGVSKLATSKMVLAKAASENFPAVVVRPFLIYGKGQGRQSFLQMALDAAREGQDFPMTGGEQTRDWVSVEKVVLDLVSIASAPFKPGRIYNICTGVEIKIIEVLMLIKKHYPSFNPIIGAMPYRKSELMRSVGIPYAGISKTAAVQELSDFIAKTKQQVS